MSKFAPYFGAAIIFTIMFGTMYGVVQQAQRRDGNWPQIQLAEDAANALDQGKTPSAQVGDSVDMATSLAPFVIIYNKSGQSVAGSGKLNGQTPRVSIGVLQAANGKPYHTVSWQPQSNVRVAAVTVAAKNYYVLSGRSLTEVEKNESRTLEIASTSWFASMLVLVLTYVLQTKVTTVPPKKL